MNYSSNCNEDDINDHENNGIDEIDNKRNSHYQNYDYDKSNDYDHNKNCGNNDDNE